MRATRRASRRKSGFTLIELMVAVALIGILAATAVTSFQLYQLRSKRSEAKVNLAALRTSQLAYFHEAGSFVRALQSPGLAGHPTYFKANWKLGDGFFPNPGEPPGDGFQHLGWEPEGPTFFDYDTNTVLGSGGFTAAAYGDTDGDGFLSVFLYVSRDSTGASFPSRIGGFVVPFDPTTCDPHWSTVAQVPFTGACGFPVADDY